MPTKARIKKVLADVQNAYKKCWAVLITLKTGDRSRFSAEEFLDFQPTLCSALMDLDHTYREIETEKNSLIRKKTGLAASWFKTRMAALGNYQQICLEAIKIGRFCGDSFAWFFYQNERGYLVEHLRQKGQRHLPPGIGGLGEKEFVKNIRGIFGKMAIYHGTTTFLRMGDVSLIDLKTLRLTALGEIKTVKVGPGAIKLRIELMGPKDRPLPVPAGPSRNSSMPDLQADLSATQRDRLRRQMSRIQDTIVKESNRKIDAQLSLSAIIHYAQLDKLVESTKKGRFSYVQVGDGLVLGAYRSPTTSFYSRLKSPKSPDWSQRLGNVESHIIPIMRKGADDNAIYINSLFYGEHHGPHFLLGSVPLFWWPVSPESLRSIIFQEVIVFSLYNPAHLFNRLRMNGFEVIESDKREWRLTKRVGETILALERFGYFLQLIQLNLASEDYVMDIVKATEDQAVQSFKHSGGKAVRFDMSIVQHIGPRPA